MLLGCMHVTHGRWMCIWEVCIVHGKRRRTVFSPPFILCTGRFQLMELFKKALPLPFKLLLLATKLFFLFDTLCIIRSHHKFSSESTGNSGRFSNQTCLPRPGELPLPNASALLRSQPLSFSSWLLLEASCRAVSHAFPCCCARGCGG
jgi:hypothetical protein